MKSCGWFALWTSVQPSAALSILGPTDLGFEWSYLQSPILWTSDGSFEHSRASPLMRAALSQPRVSLVRLAPRRWLQVSNRTETRD